MSNFTDLQSYSLLVSREYYRHPSQEEDCLTVESTPHTSSESVRAAEEVCDTVITDSLPADALARLLAVPKGSGVFMLADRRRMSQVLTNYVTNALRYSPPDQPVQIGMTVGGEVARAWARDRGSGPSAEAQQEIWQPFHQVKDIPVQSGSGKRLGLGLFICQTLIAEHQGAVRGESTPGEDIVAVLQQITSSGKIEPKDETEKMETAQTLFKWRHFEAEMILLCVRWYLRYALSSLPHSR